MGGRLLARQSPLCSRFAGFAPAPASYPGVQQKHENRGARVGRAPLGTDPEDEF